VSVLQCYVDFSVDGQQTGCGEGREPQSRPSWSCNEESSKATTPSRTSRWNSRTPRSDARVRLPRPSDPPAGGRHPDQAPVRRLLADARCPSRRRGFEADRGLAGGRTPGQAICWRVSW
jgi:hypothetical protein